MSAPEKLIVSTPLTHHIKFIDFLTVFGLILTARLDFAGVQVLLLPRSGVLKPDLRDPFAETSDLRYSLQILAVGIGVKLEVGLQHLQLLLGECGAHPFRLVLLIALGIATL